MGTLSLHMTTSDDNTPEIKAPNDNTLNDNTLDDNTHLGVVIWVLSSRCL
jgi:hypothetical protein